MCLLECVWFARAAGIGTEAFAVHRNQDLNRVNIAAVVALFDAHYSSRQVKTNDIQFTSWWT